MAMAKLLLVLVVALFAIMFVESSKQVDDDRRVPSSPAVYQVNRYGQGSLRSYQCSGQCSRRCSRTQYKKPCLFFCNKCCAKCLCVPPGFYGNKGVCPCYNNWKTQQGGPKCP